jgi:hypothetical protein
MAPVEVNKQNEESAHLATYFARKPEKIKWSLNFFSVIIFDPVNDLSLSPEPLGNGEYFTRPFFVIYNIS